MESIVPRISANSTVRLYAWLLENAENEVSLSIPQFLARTGIGTTESFNVARQELQDLKFITSDRLNRSSYTLKLVHPIAPRFTPTPVVDSEDSLADRCMMADGMPEGGSQLDPRGEFQVKRKAQVELLKEIFSTYFPDGYPLTDGGAKDLLRTQPSTEEILMAVELIVSQGKEIRSPLGYLKTTLLQRIQRGETSVATGNDDDMSAEQKAIASVLGDEVDFTNPWAEFEVPLCP